MRTISLKLRVRRTPRLPHVTAVRAVRRGGRVRVMVRLRRASESTLFYATGQTRRGDPPVTLGLPGPAAAGRKRFSITLAHARVVRFVTLGVLPWSRRYATTREIRVG